MIDENINSKSTMKINIFGKEYSIRSVENSDYVAEVARYVDSKMIEVDRSTASSNPVQVSVLAAMNITDEFFSERQKTQELFSTIDERCKELIERISSVIHQE
ncbi:cell division protein ZapA [bacterium]|nr:cell division protein ZapA [bacterium]